MPVGIVGVGIVYGAVVVAVDPLSKSTSFYGGLSIVGVVAAVVDEGSGGGTTVNISCI